MHIHKMHRDKYAQMQIPKPKTYVDTEAHTCTNVFIAVPIYTNAHMHRFCELFIIWIDGQWKT